MRLVCAYVAGAQAPSVQSYVQNPTSVDQSYFGTGALVAQAPAASFPAAEASPSTLVPCRLLPLAYKEAPICLSQYGW